jgi:hypothetical protein
VQLKRDIETDRATLDLVEQELAEAAANGGPKPLGLSSANPARQLAPPRDPYDQPPF